MAKRRPAKKQDSAQTIFTRFLLIVAFFVVWIGVIGVRLVHLQVNQSDWLRDKALDQRRYELKSKMLRGSILDSSGRALAISVKVKSLYADPREIEDAKKTAQKIGNALKMNSRTLETDILDAKEKGKRFVWLARKLDEEKAQKLNEVLKDDSVKKFDEPKFQGLHWREEQKRSYPYGTLASQVVGFSDLDDIGRAGIELSQEQSLRGAVIKKWRDRDRLGRVYDEFTDEEDEREPPKDVVLTINNSIQYKVEQALKEGVENANAKSGTAIVIDPKTGEVLAMANYPTYDPNKSGEASPENYANRAIQNIYAPGSVFKTITYSSALEEKVVAPTDTINCGNGAIDVAGHVFTDKHCHQGLTVTDAYAVSSNIGAIRTALGLGKDRFYNYSRQFGFGEQTGIELPGEVRGQMRSPESWNGDSLASMAIGYEMGVTALQTAAAFATIANDGLRIKPHIIKEIRSSNGEETITPQAEKIQVVSPETARSMRRMMQKVVLSGTGKRAQLNGYSSAGKTGTAWKFDAKTKRVSAEKYVSSFIGFAPVDDPALVIAVVMDEPRGAMRDGGQVSAPVFRQIAEQVLPELNIIPDGTLRQAVGEEIKESSEVKEVFGDKDKVSAVEIVGADTAEKNKTQTKTLDQNAENKISRKGEKEKSEKKDSGEKNSDKDKRVNAVPKPKPEPKNKSSAEAKSGVKNKTSTERTKNKT